MPWELPNILDADLVREGWRQLTPVARINEAIPKGTTPFSAISAIESTWYMRNMLLRDSDWASMAHSLEIRVPLVDIELSRGLTPLLQQSFKPDKKFMAKVAWQKGPPINILNRSKTCFAIPVREWLLAGVKSGERGHRAWAKTVYREIGSYRPEAQ
jgi:asparagine synthase (glutamine-hydrolysing)